MQHHKWAFVLPSQSLQLLLVLAVKNGLWPCFIFYWPVQVAPFDLLDSLARAQEDTWQQHLVQSQSEPETSTAAQKILSMAGNH